MMAGLRERKKEQTRRRIAEAALRLFAERGYDEVTVNEVAEAAGVAKVTLFAYFATKECLVLDEVKEDMARIVTERPPGLSPLGALRAHYRAFAREAPGVDAESLLTRVRVISGSPALLAGVHQAHIGQRYELAAALEREPGDLIAHFLAAQVTAVVTTLQEQFFHRLTCGASLAEAGRRLADEVDVAFDLLDHGFAASYGDKS